MAFSLELADPLGSEGWNPLMGKTLRMIADRLGVQPDEIESY